MIDLMPNVTFFIQLGIFLFTLFGLNILLFKPVLRLIAKREELTKGYRQEAEELGSKTESLVNTCEAKMKAAREEGLGHKNTLMKEGETEAQDIMNQAREDLEGTLEGHRKDLATESKEAQLSLRKSAREISEEMAEKILGRKVSA